MESAREQKLDMAILRPSDIRNAFFFKNIFSALFLINRTSLTGLNYSSQTSLFTSITT